MVLSRHHSLKLICFGCKGNEFFQLVNNKIAIKNAPNPIGSVFWVFIYKRASNSAFDIPYKGAQSELGAVLVYGMKTSEYGIHLTVFYD